MAKNKKIKFEDIEKKDLKISMTISKNDFKYLIEEEGIFIKLFKTKTGKEMGWLLYLDKTWVDKISW